MSWAKVRPRVNAGPALCPYCRETVEDSDTRRCDECGVVAHVDCLEEAKVGCLTLGCRARPVRRRRRRPAPTRVPAWHLEDAEPPRPPRRRRRWPGTGTRLRSETRFRAESSTSWDDDSWGGWSWALWTGVLLLNHSPSWLVLIAGLLAVGWLVRLLYQTVTTE